ncbi:MAG: helix-turn-helix domain-containing protein [Nitrososphaerota archaeon]|nr:helix-turn-helix domain-containing protein [Nitrososphaerota archaeon]
MSTTGRLHKPKEAAELLNVSRQTIWAWIKGGKIKAVRLPSGQHRIPDSEVVKILQGAR